MALRREGERSGVGVRDRFEEVYQVLKRELLYDPAVEYDPNARRWVEQMVDYNVPGGKLNRGLSVIETVCSLKEEEQVGEEELFKACVVGWCIQWLVACVLVLDDILDASHTRRGRPCWYRQPGVGMVAVNDGVLLWNHIHRILRNHFRQQPYYVQLLELFNEIEFQTASGEMLDLISNSQHLSHFTPQLHARISRFKTAYGTFYLPFASALLILGHHLHHFTHVKDILLDMGIYFQVQDDYLDCFGDPDSVGKIGTDIQDFKCSWLVVKALQLCNEEQRKLLYDNYGSADAAKVGIVKSLYNDLNLQGVYADYENEVHQKIRERIEALPCKAVQSVLNQYLDKIYKRKK